MDDQGRGRSHPATRLPGAGESARGSPGAPVPDHGGEPLLDQPRIGQKLGQFEAREVRRILLGKYAMRYEVRASSTFILRVWHTREDR
jgi:hypothetical protein